MIKGLVLSFMLTLSADQTAWDIPYGVQDPLLGSGGWMNCEGHEIGHWNVVQRTAPNGKTAIFLVLTTVDLVDPAFVICIVPPDRKVMVMETGKGT